MGNPVGKHHSVVMPDQPSPAPPSRRAVPENLSSHATSHAREHRRSGLLGLGVPGPDILAAASHDIVGEAAKGSTWQAAGGTGRQAAGCTGPMVVCHEPRLLDLIAAAAASAGAEPMVVGQPRDIRQHWAQASAVLVGEESAALVAGLALPERAGVYVLGADAASAAAWSVPLSASVIELPEHAGFLPAVLSQSRADGASGTVVLDIAGGSGGVGASTLAAALAQRCAASSRTVALVDCDPVGGGLDLLLGAEHEPGWRWPDLSSATGTVGDLSGRLPRVAGVDLLSVGRGAVGTQAGAAKPPVAQPAFRAVLDAVARSHDVVVMDNPGACQWRAPGRVQRVVVVAAEVRAIMAARAHVEGFGWQDACVVVRRGPGCRIAPATVAESLGLRLAGSIPTDLRFPEAVATGVPLRRGRPGRRFRFLDTLLEQVCGDA
ncbi:helicase/secretion neighborhood CpaE-like protein [Propionibacterium cyclohexanicum]|uniref:Helicase/secretion neighborhood CpaE-like protein n=2 Tax=Propionibacterium cyclohexanicum TaxID=64702 RepID=A0A1H9TC01_9ACTN|nr:helicase/secretion neighborhood CpaE-like protein [Propionibacterium cyclohexanicum]